MPTYEYSCVSCGRSLEVVQKMTDPSLTSCEECGGLLKKVFHPAGIMFKGSGFYATDNRSKPKSSSSTGSGDGSEKKPADKKSSETKSSETKSDAASSSADSPSESKKSAPAGKADKGSN